MADAGACNLTKVVVQLSDLLLGCGGTTVTQVQDLPAFFMVMIYILACYIQAGKEIHMKSSMQNCERVNL